MKKMIPAAGIIMMLCFALVLTASTQQGKEKQQHGNGNKGKANKEHNTHGNNMQKENHPAKNAQKEKNNGNKDRVKIDKEDHGNSQGQSNKDKNENIQGQGNGHKNKDRNYYNTVYGYNWNNENFKERKKIRNQDKVTICHKISNGNDGVAINVSENAVKAHLNHGDILGDCPVYNNRQYGDIFYRNRNDYYNTLQTTQEQVYYSQSVLEYALAKLTNGRSQLLLMQNNNAPLADIQRRQESVVQLEQNVSLLQTLIGVAVNVVANKLQ